LLVLLFFAFLSWWLRRFSVFCCTFLDPVVTLFLLARSFIYCFTDFKPFAFFPDLAFALPALLRVTFFTYLVFLACLAFLERAFIAALMGFFSVLDLSTFLIDLPFSAARLARSLSEVDNWNRDLFFICLTKVLSWEIFLSRVMNYL